MRYAVWVLRLLVFVVVLLFALKNTNPVDVRFYADHVVTGIPLIVVMLVAFVVGIVFALLALVPATLRRRGEIRRLRREVDRLSAASPPDSGTAVAPESVAPLSPL